MNLIVASYPEVTKVAGTSECSDNAIRDALGQAGNVTRATEYRSCEKLGLPQSATTRNRNRLLIERSRLRSGGGGVCDGAGPTG